LENKKSGKEILEAQTENRKPKLKTKNHLPNGVHNA
jgi:hypothetical protein